MKTLALIPIATFFLLSVSFAQAAPKAKNSGDCSRALGDLLLPHPALSEVVRLENNLRIFLLLYPQMFAPESVEDIYTPLLESMRLKAEKGQEYTPHERETYAYLRSKVDEKIVSTLPASQRPRLTPPPGKGWETERFD